jgi:crossover junction endodeoxyribonuclease RusA
VINLVLPYPISANRYWRHAVVCNRAQVYLSAEAKAYKAEVLVIARNAGLRIPLDGRIAWKVRLFPQRPQDWAKRAQKAPDTWDDDVRCMDLGNCEKVLADALNGIAWLDDKQIRRTVLERMEPDGEARVEVTIRPMVVARVAPELFTEAAA